MFGKFHFPSHLYPRCFGHKSAHQDLIPSENCSDALRSASTTLDDCFSRPLAWRCTMLDHRTGRHLGDMKSRVLCDFWLEENIPTSWRSDEKLRESLGTIAASLSSWVPRNMGQHGTTWDNFKLVKSHKFWEPQQFFYFVRDCNSLQSLLWHLFFLLPIVTFTKRLYLFGSHPLITVDLLCKQHIHGA